MMTCTMPLREGSIAFKGYSIWYRVVGDESSISQDVVPVLALHGGPGIPHESLKPLEQLALSGRPVIFFDQLGCGNSDRPENISWDISIFLEEIAAVREALQLDRVHLFGHSWGGMLALEYALLKQETLGSLILASTPADAAHMFAGQQRIWQQLPADILALLKVPGEERDAARQRAIDYFDKHFYCRCDPWPTYLLQARSPEKRNIALNQYMWGSVLREWNIVPRLHEITLPTLITAGYHDGIAVGQDAILREHIAASQRVVFADSSHYAHAEETERYIEVLQHFLHQGGPA